MNCTEPESAFAIALYMLNGINSCSLSTATLVSVPRLRRREVCWCVETNDPVAWDRLLALYAPLVWHWCHKTNLPQQEIADVFQEVFQAVAVHIRDFHKDRPKDTFRGWLADHHEKQSSRPFPPPGTRAQSRRRQRCPTGLVADSRGELGGRRSGRQHKLPSALAAGRWR